MIIRQIKRTLTAITALMLLLPGPVGVFAGDAHSLSFRDSKILYQAHRALKVGDPAQAIRIIEQYQQQKGEPLSAPFFSFTGICHYRLAEYTQAIRAYENASKQKPMDGDLALKLATCLYLDAAYEKAGYEFARAYRLISPPRADLLYQSAVAFYQGKKYVESAEILDQLIGTTTVCNTAWMELMLSCQLELEQWRKAETIIDKLLRKQPDHEAYWRLLSQLYLRQKRYKQAALAMDVMLQLVSPSDEDLQSLAGLYSYLNLPLRSVELLSKAYGHRPAPDEIKTLASFYQRGFDYKSALATVDQGIAAWPDDSSLRSLKTQLLYAKGDYEAVMSENASPVSPTSAERLLQGYAAWHIGNWGKARSFFMQAMRDSRLRDSAKTALDVIERILQSEKDARAPLSHTTFAAKNHE